MSNQYLIIEHLTTKDLIRIFSKIRINKEKILNGSPCWEWTGARSAGYGNTNIRTTYHLTHRLMFAWLVCPIPKGHGRHVPQLDHLCHNRRCANPLHLELVSMTTNLMRGESPSARCARKTHCKNQHPLSGDNLYRKPSGERCCRICRKEAKRKRQERERQVKLLPIVLPL